ncbi:hypothetical protein DSM05_00390 [Pseudomonas sp. FW305-3-2-15-E-TSA4]|nr:hypothetical protein [Pseudomonas sp. FW305-3-2-15-E-TSA4]
MVLSRSNFERGGRHGRCDLSGDRGRGVRRLRPAGHSVEAGVTMIAMLWGAGALVVAVYMVAALLRPERF